MSNIQTENLEERIERIKKRNEEIEKKYREAEEDRLMALKDNAMVNLKITTNTNNVDSNSVNDPDDWPKEHKYDNYDFNYDDDKNGTDETNETKSDEKNEANKSIGSTKEHKIFPDGEGPPPDPQYNFLADYERDGKTTIVKKDANTINNNERKDNNQQTNKNNSRGNSNANFTRGRNPKTRGGHNNNTDYRSKYNKNDNVYKSWKNEREKIDEERINRQKVGDNKWRREWDNDKLNGNSKDKDGQPKQENTINNNNNNNSGTNTGTGPVTHNSSKSTNFNKILDRQSQSQQHQRSNITVSISNDGEVKSVKLTSPPIIGSGRVGPRQIMKPQFEFNKDNGQSHNQHQQHYPSKKLPNHNDNKKPFVNTEIKKRQSVQDRLLNRTSQPQQQEQQQNQPPQQHVPDEQSVA